MEVFQKEDQKYSFYNGCVYVNDYGCLQTYKNESGNETMLIFGNDCCDMWVWKIKHKVSPEAE